MNDPAPLLDRAGIGGAFRRLGDRLAKRGVVADIYVFGGAAMALAYDSRRATRDVGALFKPHGSAAGPPSSYFCCHRNSIARETPNILATSAASFPSLRS